MIRGRVTSMKRKLLKHGWQLPTGMSLVMIFGYALARAQEGQPRRTYATGKPPYNMEKFHDG